jgi:hypothetical protein
LCCWSVAAQTADSSGAAQQQEGVRVAKLEPKTAPIKRAPFSRTIASPWEDLGGQPGYVSVRVAELLEHPLYAASLPAMWENTAMAFKENEDGTRPTFSDFSLTLDSISRIDTVLQFSVTDIPLEKGAGGERAHTQSINIGANGAVFHASKDIDWPKVVDSLDLNALGFSDNGMKDTLLSQLKKDARLGRELKVNSLQVQQPEAEQVGVELESGHPKFATHSPMPTPAERQIWNHVSGGVVTVFYRTGDLDIDSPLEDVAEHDELSKSVAATQKLIDSTAIGVDISPSPHSEFVRIALQPRKDVTAEKLNEHVNRLMQLMIDQAMDGDEQVADQIGRLKVETITEDSASYVAISGELSIGYMMGLQFAE